MDDRQPPISFLLPPKKDRSGFPRKEERNSSNSQPSRFLAVSAVEEEGIDREERGAGRGGEEETRGVNFQPPPLALSRLLVSMQPLYVLVY